MQISIIQIQVDTASTILKMMKYKFQNCQKQKSLLINAVEAVIQFKTCLINQILEKF